MLDTSAAVSAGTFSQIAPVSSRAAYAIAVTCTEFKAAGTIDGGANWFETLGKLPGQGYGNLVFLSPTTGFAFGSGAAGASVGNDGAAVRTTDGGAHWQAVGGVLPTVVDIVAVGGDVWALSEPANGTGALSIKQSPDEGATWRPIPASPPGAMAGGYSRLLRPTLRSAFVLAKGPLDLGFGRGRLLFTGDGGATWSPRADPCTQAGFEDLAAVNDADLWAVCAGPRVPATTGGPGSRKEAHWVYRSSDSGRTWRLVAAPPAAEVPSSGQVPPLAVLGRLAAVDSQHAWIALGGAGAGLGPPGDQGIFVTADGGATWHQAFPMDPNGQGGTPDVAFLGPTNGWAVADAGTWRTVDGVSWTRVVPCRPRPGC